MPWNMSAASKMRSHRSQNCAVWMASSAAISIRHRSAGSETFFISTMETGLKAARPLSKMPADIWRSFVGPLAFQHPPTAAPRRCEKPRLYPRRVRRMTAGAAMPAGRFPVTGQEHLKVLIVTDAWRPQVNGVVTTLELLGRELRALGHEVRYATPEGRFTLPLPTYPDIRLAFFPRTGLEKLFRDFAPDAVHIATEGTMGLSARAICIRHGIEFTTCYHTRFPEYVHV